MILKIIYFFIFQKQKGKNNLKNKRIIKAIFISLIKYIFKVIDKDNIIKYLIYY